MEGNLFGFLTGLVGLVGIFITARRAKAAKRHSADAAEAIGQKNGKGTLTEIGEQLLELAVASQKWQVNHDQRDDLRFAKVDERFDRLEN